MSAILTGREPHPVLALLEPDIEKTLIESGAGKQVEEFYAVRKEAMLMEKLDPFRYGYESPIWHTVDDLLVDGNTIVLCSDSNIAVPKEIEGAPEIWISGSQRSSKSEYAAKKNMKVLLEIEDARGWAFADTETVSIARQQPLFWKYMPLQWRVVTAQSNSRGFRQGQSTKINWNKSTGFTGGSFVLPPPYGSQQWFKNYKQEIGDMEGDQLDVVWLDELRDIDLLKTLRYRMGDRSGIIIVTFTSINQNYSNVVSEYDNGSVTMQEVAAELLPIRDDQGKETGEFEKVPRIKVAGRGTDGNQRANIVFFHITDNPYYGVNAKPKAGEVPVFGKERFYKRFKGASRQKILSHAYGVLLKTTQNQFTFKDTVHIISVNSFAAWVKKYPRASRYMLVDPCSGRNWYMGWIFCPFPGKKIVYREWPSHGHPEAYIPGIGMPGPWTLPGAAVDGERGPAQEPFKLGLDRYKGEIDRLENGEVITERWMDARSGNFPTTEREGAVTLIEKMEEVGLEFMPMTSEKNILNANDGSIDLINTALAYDESVAIGEFSAKDARLNEPDLIVVENCPNMIYSLQNWTGKDGQVGACKDPIDVLRGAFLSELDHIDETAMQPRQPWMAALGR